MVSNQLEITQTTRRLKEEELVRLKTVDRPRVVEQVKRAREYGDLSENFEYQAARQEQAILNGKIAEIEALLDRAKVVPDPERTTDQVGLHSRVTVYDPEDEDEDEWEMVIVDDASAMPNEDRFSISSPIGQALIGRRLGDIVEVGTPSGKHRYEIRALKHDE